MTIVELLHHARTKSFCHILTQTKKQEGKNSIPPSPNPNCNTMSWPFGYKALLTTAVHSAIFNIMWHIVKNGTYMKNNPQ